MRTTKKGPAIRPTPLYYMAGIFALLLVCCSLLCIYWYTAPAHASSGSQQAKGKTMSGQVAFDDTETEMPSQTATTTPSPTATTTFTPTPSPSATRTATPAPTSTKSATPTATGQPSPTTTGMQTPSPRARPTSSATSISTTMQGIGVNQTPMASPTSADSQGDRVSRGASRPGNTLPISSLTLGLGSVILLGLLCIAGWVVLRRRLLPLSSPKFPPSGAAPWSRTCTSDQVPPFTLQDKMTGSIASFAPSAGVITVTPGLYPSTAVSRPGNIIAQGSNPPASLHALPTMADVPVPNQPAPSSRDPATTAVSSRASHASSPVSSGWSFDSPFLAARIKRRRDELRAAAGLSAFQKQVPGELSAEITELSDPYLQSLIQLYRERGQTVRQSPHRRS